MRISSRTSAARASRLSSSSPMATTHGNGPQVGNLLIQNEAAAALVPAVPLDVCGAETQGQIGYMIQQALRNELSTAGLPRPVASVVTQVVVDADDPAFATPTKPIGPFLPAEVAARRMRDKGETWAQVDHRGWRKLTPSPSPWGSSSWTSSIGCWMPARWSWHAEAAAFRCCALPTDAWRGSRRCDKDLVAARLALDQRVAALLFLTDVPGVAVDYGKPTERFLRRTTLSEFERLLVREPFSAGSMGPKVRAAYRFVRDTGGRATICALEDACDGARGAAGTVIVPDEKLQLTLSG